MNEKTRTFTCAGCGNTETIDATNWSEEDALQEATIEFGNECAGPIDVVCDDCYELILKRKNA